MTSDDESTALGPTVSPFPIPNGKNSNDNNSVMY